MITHKGTQTIHTERLKLRRFTVDDAKAMFDNWAMEYEGTKREYFKALNGEFLDISDYGIIRSEWEKL